MPSFPELAGPLTDGVVALRFGAERDIPEILIAFQDDRQLHERLGIDRPPSGAELGRGFEAAGAERAAGRNVRLTILEAPSDTCRGEITSSLVDWHHRRVELGMWLAPQVRGRGIAPRALRLASTWLLRDCGFERVQLLTEPDNAPMRQSARAAGFVEEGILRGYTRERGQRVDCAILSLLATDLDAP